MPAVQPANTMIYRYMDTVGDGSGDKQAIRDFSASASQLIFKASAGGGGAYLYRMIIYIEDTDGMQADEYGNLGAALSAGWELKVFTSADEELLDITDGVPVQTNGQIARFCYDVDVKDWGTTPTDNGLTGRFTFERAGAPLYLEPGDKLQIDLTDDMSGLIEHTFMVQGIQRY